MCKVQFFEKTVVIPESLFSQDTQTSESLGAAPVRRVCFAETVDVVEFVPPLPAESAPPVFGDDTRDGRASCGSGDSCGSGGSLWSSLSQQHQQLPTRHLLPWSCLSFQHPQLPSWHLLPWWNASLQRLPRPYAALAPGDEYSAAAACRDLHSTCLSHRAHYAQLKSYMMLHLLKPCTPLQPSVTQASIYRGAVSFVIARLFALAIVI